MKKFLNYFFVALGVIFFIIICFGIYIWFADPFGLRSHPDIIISSKINTERVVSSDKNPFLSEEQEMALEKIGIDPASLPTEITPEMEDCFVDVLGEDRTSEIKNGDNPTVKEVFLTRSCY